MIHASLVVDPPTQLADELFTTLLEPAGVRIERIASHSHASLADGGKFSGGDVASS